MNGLENDFLTGWVSTRLGELYNFEYGKSLTKGSRAEAGRYPVYGSSGIVGTHDQFLIEGPAIIVGRKGAAGSVHYSADNSWPIDTTYYVRDDKNLCLKFSYYLFRSLNLAKLEASTAIPGLNRNHAYNETVLLPPFPEQHRIVAKIEELFSELDKGIENLKTARAQLKVYRQALLKHAFEGKLTAQWRAENQDAAQGRANAAGGQEPGAAKLETADALLKRIQQERTQRYQQQLANWEAAGKQGSKPKAPKSLPPLAAEELAELPELPEGWGWVKLAHIQSHDNYAVKAGPFGSALKKEFYVQEGYKIYGQEQVIRGDSEYGDYFVDASKYKELSSCAVKPFDILISLVGTIGKVLVLPETAKPGIINPRLVKITLNLDCYRASFFKSYFESGFLRSLYAKESQGTTMDILNLGMIQRLPYPLCSLEEQKVILELLDARLSEVDQLELTLTTSLQQAEALRQSILKKAFSGQLVPQDPYDEPASKLLARIKSERAKSPQPPFAKGGRLRGGGGISAKPRKKAVGDKLSPTAIIPLTSMDKES
ncbi:MAG: restriction endonuclease subunit S [Geobacteraceae bacterium]